MLRDRPELLNHIRSQHAGAFFTVAETASDAAMVGALGGLSALVRSATITYLKVARGKIDARAALSKPRGSVRARFDAQGNADFTVAVTLTDADDVEVARFTVAWSLRASSTRA